MTPAIRVVKRAKVPFRIHTYKHDPQADSFGKEAAEMLGVDPSQVFKTLVVTLHGAVDQYGIGIVPVLNQLDMKIFAEILKAKKAQMTSTKEAERITGYIVGGISPLGQKKVIQTVLDTSASNYETIYISAGRRGVEVELAVTDLLRLCKAKIESIGRTCMA